MKDKLKILMIAPTPFFADRGCHVRIYEEIRALQGLGCEIILCTYHIGRDMEGVRTGRIINIPWYNKLEAGPSWQKPLLDMLLLIKSFRVARRIKPDIIHAHLHDYGCTMKAYKKEVVQNLNLYGEMHRFLPALASIYGVKVSEVVVSHHPRLRGKSKYGLSRILKVFLDLMTVKFLLSYSTKPIRLFGPLALSLFSGATAVYLKIFDELSLNRNPLFLLSVVLLFMGIQLISLGLIAEMNVRTYHESQNKPIYVVKEVLN